MKCANYINGAFVETETYMDAIDPSTLEVIGAVPLSNSADVDKAVEAASAAFDSWSSLQPRQRAEYLFKIADEIDANMEELALLESRDQGKTVAAARMIDIPRAATNFRYFAESIISPKLDRVSYQSVPNVGEMTSVAGRVPVGVAALIAPWNLPLYLLSWKIAPAIAYGNTAVAKPSEVTSLTAFRLAQIMDQAGLPPGVVNIVFGTGPMCGEPLVLHPKTELISFTGSTGIGARILEKTAPLVKRVSLELGGKNPAIVFGDANFDKAVAECVRSAFTNSGQVCLCTERTFVHESIYAAFVAAFIKQTAEWSVGDPREPGIRLGPVVSTQHHAKVTSMLDRAAEKGFVAFGHSKRDLDLKEKNAKGCYVSPTVLTGVPDEDEIWNDEVFGPVTAINSFKTEDEVIKRANDTQYGLCATVFTEDIAKANRVARKIRAGTVWVNCWLRRDLNMPFGGMKRSGIGRESGFDSEEFFTEPQCVAIMH